ncbi:pyrimidine reductase [Falsochrobactrum shanghaiense]|uniref:Pyrimidine reductase n=1 Tax=Falsochrobactrum shanghaiense TaxID=2201899 RepID=A0A316JMQ7_9HYPH|nr:RibD family protein [Falsochrobactrum shanghaiense]PWL16500.1 pyrimidine reductase [Falsochrobactrum shanghaiense]
MARPKIIIHMHTSLNGKINGPHLRTEESEASQVEYYNLFLGPDPFYRDHCGWLSGSTTSEVNFTHYKEPDLDPDAKDVPPGDFLAEHDERIHYFAIDRAGKLAWSRNFITYFDTRAHVVEIIPDNVSNAYKDFLRRMNVSYIIAGKEELDFAAAVSKIQQIYGKNELLLNGGGGVNWSLLKQGLVDEVSIVMTPVADGSTDSASLFDGNPKYNDNDPVGFELIDTKKLPDGSVWLRYNVK